MSTRTDDQPTTSEPSPSTPKTRRVRRLRRALVITAAVLVVLFIALTFGVGWFFSSVALDVVDDPPATVAVKAVVAGDAIELARSPQPENAGLHAVRHPDGYGIMSEQVAISSDAVVRAWRDVEGTLSGSEVAGVVDSDVYQGDPSAVGLDHTDITVTSDIGDLPTWLVPTAADAPAAAADTWIVFAHGRGGSVEEALRYLPMWHDLGHPVLVPAYRNDPGAPADPRGWYGLGETEWRDIDAAVTYALDNGAQDVVLAGWSMGGAIAMQLLDRSEHADAISGLVLNAPVLDWRDTFDYQGSTFGLPSYQTALAVRLVEARAGIDFDDYDWVRRADDVPDLPIYLVHSADDTYVPNDPSIAFAAARPDIVTFEQPSGADHTREWNVDPEGYEAAMTAWFDAEID